jgi:hypothetical protein
MEEFVYLHIVSRPTHDVFTYSGAVTIAREGLQKVVLCLALKPFEHGGMYILPHLL